MATKAKAPPPPVAPGDGEKSEESSAPVKKGGQLKLIIIVVLAMVVGGGGAFGAMMFFGSDPPPAVVEVAEEEIISVAETEVPLPDDIEAPARDNVEAETETDGDPAVDGEEAPEEFIPQNIEFKSFVANIGGSGGQRFLKLTMSIEAETQELATEIDQKMPQFRDMILLLLSSLAYDDIATLDGKMRLRSQMLNRINSQLSSGKVKNIYFSEFVVQ